MAEQERNSVYGIIRIGGFMAREAIIEMDCSRYSEKIIDIINLFNNVGWKYYDGDENVEYLPLGDDDDFDWQKQNLSEKDLCDLVNRKQAAFEIVGINLFYNDSNEGITFLASNTKEIVLNLNLYRRTLNDDSRDSITDIGWYFDNIIQKIKEKECPIDYIKFEEYEG